MQVDAKPGFLLCENKDGTWTVDFDDNTDADVPAAAIVLAAAAAGAEEEKTEEILARLDADAAAKQREHDAAIKSNDWKAAGALLEDIQRIQDERRRAARGDQKLAREKERRERQERLDALRSDFEKSAGTRIEEMQERSRRMAPT